MTPQDPVADLGAPNRPDNATGAKVCTCNKQTAGQCACTHPWPNATAPGAVYERHIDALIIELRSEREPERDYRIIVNAQVATLEALRQRVERDRG